MKIAATSSTAVAAPAQGDAPARLVRIVIVGHVDHGKSTLIGRLIHDTGSLPDGKLEAIKAMSERRGMPFEWSFLLDALQAERDQGITIDTSQIRFRTPERDVLLIDAPGHVEFLKNMVTGAAQADAALLVIDAAEGVREQSKRHGYLLHLLGIRQVAVVVNKMDKVGFSREVFADIETEYRAYLAGLGVEPLAFIPVAARTGDMNAQRGERLGWHTGPTVAGMIDRFEPARALAHMPLRLAVQDVYKFDDRRIVAGRIEAGRLEVGDELVFLPSGRTARVATIETWPTTSGAARPLSAESGRSIGITLDREIFVERGEIASRKLDPVPVTRIIKSRIFWLGRDSLNVGSRLRFKIGPADADAVIAAIESVVDTGRLTQSAATTIDCNAVADVTITLSRPVAADLNLLSPPTGRFVLEMDGCISGGGIVLAVSVEAKRRASPNVTPVASAVTVPERVERHGHRGAVIWLTGLPSSGKSTIGRALERVVFDRGGQVVLLDGDTLRTGLNGDLGFSEQDRSENIRRTAEVAAFLAKQGQIAIVALVSPTAKDRGVARGIAGALFHEVHIKADVETCASRDPKGLYARAKAGQIKGFTGVSAPYEAPTRPEVVVDTDSETVLQGVARIVGHLQGAGVIDLDVFARAPRP
jgi:bifunctional enzyme CysN/CysC